MSGLNDIDRRLCEAVAGLHFDDPIAYVYNPLEYARQPREEYNRRFGSGRKDVVFLGMNPGPFGMAQTGVPFGEVGAVRDWMGISGSVGKPAREHPKRPVLGFECARSEVSGARLWGWARDRYGSAEAFFERFFVINYCPLLFLEDGGRNLTPDKIAKAQRAPLQDACDLAVREAVELLQPSWVIGVGLWAKTRAETALGRHVKVGSMLHPSPASPKANRGWAQQAEAELREYGIELQ